MIKKLFSTMLLAAVLVMGMSSCGSEDKEQQRVCKEISEAMTAQKFDKVTELCGSLYERLPACSVKTLGDLTMSYITLSAVGIANSNEDQVVDCMRHAVDCYDEAMKKDPNAAKKLWDEMASKKNEQGLSINPTEIVEIFRQQLSAYDAATAAADSIQPSAESELASETALEVTEAVSQD